MTPVMQQFFETLTDGILIVTIDGKVRFINEAARKHLQLGSGDFLPPGPLQRFAASAMSGHLQIPSSIELELNEDNPICTAEPARVHVVHSPAGKELILIIQAYGEARFFQAATSNFERMFERQCEPPITAIDGALHRLLAEISLLDPDLAEVRSQGESLSQAAHELLDMLRRLGALAALSGGQDILSSDRILTEEWIEDVSADFERAAHAKGVSFEFVQPHKEIAPIYGSRAWLGRALAECLDNALKFVQAKGQIKLDVRPCGNFIRITLRSTSNAPLTISQRERLARPFYRGQNAHKTRGLGIGLPLARQIVELHGGHLLISPDLDGFFSCAMELPASRDTAARAQDKAGQLERYAHDLAQIIKRSRRPAAAQES